MATRGNGAGSSRPRHHRSRITNGSKLLPTVHSQSVWARYFRDTMERLIEHVGGDQIATEPQRMISRHVAVLDTEALYLADKIGTIRNGGGEPSEKTIDLYSRVTSASRRHLETLGLDRMQRDITPSLGAYLEGKAAEGVPGGPERPGRVAVSHPTDSAASQNLASPQILDVNSPESQNSGQPLFSESQNPGRPDISEFSDSE